MVSGLVMGFVGLGFLVAPGKLGDGAHLDVFSVSWLVIAAFLWAAGSVYSRHARLPSSMLVATAMEMLTGGALLLLTGGALGEWSGFQPMHVTLRSLIAWLYLTFFGSLIGFTAYVWLLKATTMTRVSTYAYVNPVVALFLGWALAGEQVTVRSLCAAAAIILAVVIIVTQSAEAPAEV